MGFLRARPWKKSEPTATGSSALCAASRNNTGRERTGRNVHVAQAMVAPAPQQSAPDAGTEMVKCVVARRPRRLPAKKAQ
jgi:hypothetical protein